MKFFLYRNYVCDTFISCFNEINFTISDCSCSLWWQEYWTGKDVEGEGLDLIESSIPAFLWGKGRGGGGGGMEEDHKTLGQNNRSQNQDMNPRITETNQAVKLSESRQRCFATRKCQRGLSSQKYLLISSYVMGFLRDHYVEYFNLTMHGFYNCP